MFCFRLHQFDVCSPYYWNLEVGDNHENEGEGLWQRETNVQMGDHYSLCILRPPPLVMNKGSIIQQPDHVMRTKQPQSHSAFSRYLDGHYFHGKKRISLPLQYPREEIKEKD